MRFERRKIPGVQMQVEVRLMHWINAKKEAKKAAAAAGRPA
jgi:hypothetical protein